MFEPDPEVLVAGAGPVGMFAALSLARKGVTVQVVDTGWHPGMHSYALALHARSVDLLRTLGLQDAIADHSYPVRTIALYDETKRRAEVAAGDGPVAVLRQDILEEILEDALRQAGAGVSWNHRLSRLSIEPEHVNATIERLDKESRGYSVAHSEWVVASTKEIKPAYVIGADGHSSWVRRILRIGFPEVSRPQYFAVFEFESDADLGNEMRIAFSNGTTNVLWPLPDNRVRWSFELPGYSTPEAHREKDRFPVQVEAGDYPVIAQDSLRRYLAERASWFTGSIGEIAWRIIVRFEHRLAASYGTDRVWLAGDAAHLTGPAGIQSMNAGLKEASELAGIIAARSPAASVALEEYGDRHLASWRTLLGIGQRLRATPLADPWVADHAQTLLPCLPVLGDDLARIVGQLGLEFADRSVASA